MTDNRREALHFTIYCYLWVTNSFHSTDELVNMATKFSQKLVDEKIIDKIFERKEITLELRRCKLWRIYSEFGGYYNLDKEIIKLLNSKKEARDYLIGGEFKELRQKIYSFVTSF